jgi:hypothetical protein
LDTSLRNSLEALNASLNAKQIQQLNELLVWIVAAPYDLEVDLLQNILYLASGENFMLKSMVATKFSTLLRMDEDNSIKLLSDNMQEILQDQKPSGSDFLGPSTAELSEPEVELCRRFVKNTCGEYDYKRFNFDAFFDALAKKQKAHIHVTGDDELEVRMALTCMTALCERQDDENLKFLRDYASIWFYYHLQQLVERPWSFDTHKDAMADIGSKTVSLLYDSHLIDVWFMEESLETLWDEWISADSYYEPLREFLRNPHAAQGYIHNVEKNEWVESVLKESVSKYKILERVAVRLATKWFGSKTAMEERYLDIAYGIIAKVRH